MMQTDVKSTKIAASTTDGAVFAGAARIKAMTITFGAAPAVLTLKDGATTVFVFDGPGVAGSLYVVLPGEGIRCASGIYATTTAGMIATVIYG